MNTLLTLNDDFALIGDTEGKVHTETRLAELSSEEWKEHLLANYLESGHWNKEEEGFPQGRFTNYCLGQNGQMVALIEKEVAPYKSFSDASSGLSVRAAFLVNINQWIIDDREPEPTQVLACEDLLDSHGTNRRN